MLSKRAASNGNYRIHSIEKDDSIPAGKGVITLNYRGEYILSRKHKSSILNMLFENCTEPLDTLHYLIRFRIGEIQAHGIVTAALCKERIARDIGNPILDRLRQ